jgi:hypothetical protein
MERTVATTTQLNGVAYGTNQFVAVGEGATVLQSGDVISSVTTLPRVTKLPPILRRLPEWVLALLRSLWPF